MMFFPFTLILHNHKIIILVMQPYSLDSPSQIPQKASICLMSIIQIPSLCCKSFQNLLLTLLFKIIPQNTSHKPAATIPLPSPLEHGTAVFNKPFALFFVFLHYQHSNILSIFWDMSYTIIPFPTKIISLPSYTKKLITFIILSI